MDRWKALWFACGVRNGKDILREKNTLHSPSNDKRVLLEWKYVHALVWFYDKWFLHYISSRIDQIRWNRRFL